MSAMTLYQFELCPYCHKVKAGLDLKSIKYDKVEVNPMSKKELAGLGEAPEGRRKVPVVKHDDTVMRESSDILRWLDEVEPNGLQLVPSDEQAQVKAGEIDTWVNDDLTQILPTVLYGTWGESIKAAKLTAATSNFSKVDNVKVSVFGALVMKMIAKRILKRRGNGKSAQELLSAELDKLELWLGEQAYLCGDDVTLADASVHGALTCIQQFPAFRYIEDRPTIHAWYQRVAERRAAA